MKKEIKERIDAVRRGKTPDGYYENVAGIMPTDWSCAPLHAISEVLSEQAGDREFETLSISAGIGFVNQAEKFGKELSGKQYAKYTVLRRGDFAYNKGNSKRYPQGCTYMLREREEAAVPNVFECFRITEGHPEYYEQLLINGFMNKQLTRKINHGVRDDGLLNLTDEDFYSTVLPVPLAAEQQKIAEILATCDRVIELKQGELDELNKLKQTCLRKMFPQKGQTVPEVRFPGFSDPWEQRKLGEVATEMVAGGDIDKDLILYEGRYPVIANALTNDGIVGYYNADYRIKAPAVTVTGRGDVGHAKARIVDFTPVVRLLSIKSSHDVFFLENAINTLKIVVESTGVPQLTVPQLAKYEISFPKSLDEEEKIGSYFSHLDNLITLHQRELEEYGKYKKALMQLLLTGLVRVNA